MEEKIPTRIEAYELLTTYVKSESLLRHALAVEGVMRHFANIMGEDQEKWGIIGFIHDLDYEQYPEQHCKFTEQILKEKQWPESYIHAILSHAWLSSTDTEPNHVMEKILFTIDELTGLIYAACLVRPDKNIHNLQIKSIKKRWNDKRFAAAIDRKLIEKGAELLGWDLDDIIKESIIGMKEIANKLKIDGTQA